MKIILSRKGFDSGYGKVASPIFPDGSMQSLPIPGGRRGARYGEISWTGGNMGDLVDALPRCGVASRHLAHLDPDLSHAALPRLTGWRPAFGQVGAAQSHLASQGVGPGDLFLFFGWFRRVEPAGDGWRYVPRAPNLHVLFGWLQIGEILRIGTQDKSARDIWPWLADHPHLRGGYAESNTVYVASKALDLGRGALATPGGGTFGPFHPGLQLTAAEKTRSNWHLPAWFHPSTGAKLSFHEKDGPWTVEDGQCGLRTVGRGQEFVMDVTNIPEAMPWVRSLIDGPVSSRIEAA